MRITPVSRTFQRLFLSEYTPIQSQWKFGLKGFQMFQTLSPSSTIPGTVISYIDPATISKPTRTGSWDGNDSIYRDAWSVAGFVRESSPWNIIMDHNGNVRIHFYDFLWKVKVKVRSLLSRFPSEASQWSDTICPSPAESSRSRIRESSTPPFSTTSHRPQQIG